MGSVAARYEEGEVARKRGKERGEEESERKGEVWESAVGRKDGREGSR